MTVDEEIALVKSRASGRPQYEGREPWQDEVLVAEIERLRTENADISRGGVYWWHKMREIAALCGVSKLSEIVLAVQKMRAENTTLLAYVGEQPCECYDEYGKRKPQPCDRCRLWYRHETWKDFEKTAELDFAGDGEKKR